MTQEKMNRINTLARKAKEQGLTPDETAERDALRREYVQSVTASLTNQLDVTYFVNQDGTKEKLKKSPPL